MNISATDAVLREIPNLRLSFLLLDRWSKRRLEELANDMTQNLWQSFLSYCLINLERETGTHNSVLLMETRDRMNHVAVRSPCENLWGRGYV